MLYMHVYLEVKGLCIHFLTYSLYPSFWENDLLEEVSDETSSS